MTTLGFKRLYVLFFVRLVRLDTREVVHANVTTHPIAEWTVQQFRNACWDESPALLIRDRDDKFTAAFDAIVRGDRRPAATTPPALFARSVGLELPARWGALEGARARAPSSS